MNELLKMYWSCVVSKFVNKHSGIEVILPSQSPFQCTDVEWYQTLLETLVDVTNIHHRQTFEVPNKLIVPKTIYDKVFDKMLSFRPSKSDNNEGILHNRYEVFSSEKDDNVIFVCYNDKVIGMVIVLDHETL